MARSADDYSGWWHQATVGGTETTGTDSDGTCLDTGWDEAARPAVPPEIVWKALSPAHRSVDTDNGVTSGIRRDCWVR